MSELFDIESLVVNRVETHRSIADNKPADQKFVGYLSNLIPLELIHASGMQPLMLCGDPNEKTELADEFMEAAFDPITRSIFNRLLKGEYQFLDLLVLPRANDSYQRLYYYLCELHRKHSQLPIPPVYMLDLLHTPKESTAKHNAKQLNRFVSCLQVIAETSISEKQVVDAISDYNQCRQHLDTFNQLRTQHDVPGKLVNAIYCSIQTHEIGLGNNIVSSAIQSIERLSSKSDKPRLVWIGNGLDHDELHSAVESCGGLIVGDYHFYGQQFLPGRVDESGNPFDSLLHYYSTTVKSTRTPPPDIDGPITLAKHQEADALMFFFLKGEEALTWQVPKQLNAAINENLPTQVFYDEDYSLSTAFKNNLHTFIQSLK